MSQLAMKAYPAEFKERAVKLAVESEQSIAQTARRSGIAGLPWRRLARGALPALSLILILIAIYWFNPRAIGYFGFSLMLNLAIPIALATIAQMFVITVHDPDEALGFYRDALGLEVRNDVAADGFRWVTVGAPGQDVDIVLSQPHGGRSQTEGDALLTLVTQGSLQAAIFRSDDLDALFEQVRASGAEVLQEPTSQPWGARDCAFRDPSGNLVRIAQA